MKNIPTLLPVVTIMKPFLGPPKSLIKILFTLTVVVCSSFEAYGLDYKVTKLGNGITLITAYFSHAPLAHTKVMFNTAGSMTETKDSDGLTHVFEHLFFSANDLTPNTPAIEKKKRELGIASNASVSQETLEYSFYNYPTVFFDEAMELAAAMAKTLRIEESSLKREIPVILDELDRSLTQPFFAPWATKNHILLGEDLYHTTSPIGTQRKVIENATVSQIEGLRDLLFAPQNITIFVAGLVSHEKAYKTVKKHFGGWKNPPSWKPPTIPKLPKITKTQRWNFSHPRNSTTTLRFHFPAFNARTHTKETYSATLLRNLLNHENSKFYKKYIESGKWLSGGYYISLSSFNPYSLIRVRLKDNTVDTTITEVLEEIKKWSEKGYFDEENLENLKKNMLLHFRIKGDNLDQFLSSLSIFSMIVDPYYYKTYSQGLQNTTLEDIRQFVKTQLINQPYFLTVTYNPKDAQKWGVDLAGDRYYKKHIEPKLVSTNNLKDKTPQL